MIAVIALIVVIWIIIFLWPVLILHGKAVRDAQGRKPNTSTKPCCDGSGWVQFSSPNQVGIAKLQGKPWREGRCLTCNPEPDYTSDIEVELMEERARRVYLHRQEGLDAMISKASALHLTYGELQKLQAQRSEIVMYCNGNAYVVEGAVYSGQESRPLGPADHWE